MVDDCDCGQEPVVVIFVGPTQNGKSSLIKSILEYAGAYEKAHAIPIGNGNISETKSVSSYSAKVDIIEHELRDEDGAKVNVDSKIELEDLNTWSQPTGKHTHLLLLDTPGLDDSDGITPGLKTSPLPGLATDLEHKMSVLQSINSNPTINAICFVQSVKPGLGNTFQSLTRQYVNVLEQCRLNASLHFVHTHVNKYTMFDANVTKRKGFVEDKLLFKPGTLNHHFVNNVPNSEDDIEQHLAKMWLSTMLEDLASKPSHAVTNLQFPKPDELSSTEERLRMALTAVSNSMAKEKNEIEKRHTSLETEMSILEINMRRRKEECSELENDISSFDTDDLVTIEEGNEYAPARVLHSARIPLRRRFNIVIRDRYFRGVGATTCQEIGRTIGTKFLYVDAKSDWGNPARFSWKVWGSKKDHYKSQISRLREQLKQAKSSYESFERDIAECRARIATNGRDRDRLSAMLGPIRSDQATMSSGKAAASSLPLDTVLNNTHLLTGSDPLRVARFHSLSARIPSSHLPEGSSSLVLSYYSSTSSSVNDENKNWKERLWTELRRYGLAKAAFSNERQRVESILQRLQDCKSAISKPGIETCTSPNSSPEMPKSLAHMLGDAVITVDDIRSSLQDRTHLITAKLDDMREVMQRSSAVQNKIISDILQSFEAIVEDSRKTEAKWSQLYSRQLSVWSAAYDVDKELSEEDDLSIGLFTVLKQAWRTEEFDTNRMFETLYDPKYYP